MTKMLTKADVKELAKSLQALEEAEAILIRALHKYFRQCTELQVSPRCADIDIMLEISGFELVWKGVNSAEDSEN